MKSPERSQPSSGTADNDVDMAAARAAAIGSSTGPQTIVPSERGARESGRNEASPEGGTAGRHDEHSRLKIKMAEASLRVEVREEERSGLEKLQQGAAGGCALLSRMVSQAHDYWVMVSPRRSSKIVRRVTIVHGRKKLCHGLSPTLSTML